MREIINLSKSKFILTLACICLMACESLDEKPSGIATPTTYYNSPTQCEAALAGAMAPLWGWYLSPGYGNDGTGTANFSNTDQFGGGLNDLNITANHGANLWTAHYKSILNINTLLKQVNNGSLAKYPTQINEIVGQAKFIRAFNYFYLVRMFGDLPLITEDTPDPIITPITKRTPIAEVYDLIVNDFTFAMNNLTYLRDSDRPGRPSGSAAQAFLSKVYLTMATAPLNDVSKYNLAAQYAAGVIDSAEYALTPNINEVFLQSNKYSSEMIWSFNSTADDPQTDPNGGKPNEVGGYGGQLVSPYFEKTFIKQPRKDAYVLRYLVKADGVLDDYDDEFNGLDTIWYSNFVDTDGGSPYVRKLYNLPYVSLDEGYAGTSANQPILRYADILLIYAEASNHVNGAPTQKGVDALNQVINRANGKDPVSLAPVVVPTDLGKEQLATTAMNMQTFEDKVLQERSWEFCFEFGDRWFDLVRMRRLAEVFPSNPDADQNFSEDDYLFPIPTIDAAVIGQNQGY